MKKSHSTQNSGLLGKYSYLIGDIFGLEAYHDRKNKDKNRVPWQWVLWAGLIAFCVGYILPVDSAWLLLLSAAAAAIVSFARNTETVPEQVLLLTDARSPEEKAGKKPQNKEKTPRKRPNRKPRPAVQAGASTQKTEEPIKESDQHTETESGSVPSSPSASDEAVTATATKADATEAMDARGNQQTTKKTSANRNRSHRPRTPRVSQAATASTEVSEMTPAPKPKKPRRRKPAAVSAKPAASSSEDSAPVQKPETPSAQ